MGGGKEGGREQGDKAHTGRQAGQASWWSLTGASPTMSPIRFSINQKWTEGYCARLAALCRSPARARVLAAGTGHTGSAAG